MIEIPHLIKMYRKSFHHRCFLAETIGTCKSHAAHCKQCIKLRLVNAYRG
ncbi:hypothetical protein Plhal304r1_c018g0064991 [Plasmopara halstedii]